MLATSVIKMWLNKCEKIRPLIGVNNTMKPNLSAAARLWCHHHTVQTHFVRMLVGTQARWVCDVPFVLCFE
jgi:hypothetical protein